MKNKLRFVTAASLFDGHDVSINIMRRILQSKGVEVIHLGHNRSAKDVVDAAISEDAHAVAISSYQGGHNEYFQYVRELLDQNGGNNIRIFGGGGGVITLQEIQNLENKGITKIYHPKDGMELGLEGIIDDMIKKADHNTLEKFDIERVINNKSPNSIEMARAITHIENGELDWCSQLKINNTQVLGITGTGGAGKSSLIDEILLRFKLYLPNKKIALISIDPTRKRTQGALLGDRIRLTSSGHDNFFIRSLATRDSNTELSPYIKNVVNYMKSLNFDLIMIETSGIGQASDAITQVADKFMYVMTPEYGAASQLEKIEMLEVANYIVLNKYEKPRSEDALRDIRKQYRRNHKLFDNHGEASSDDRLPIYATMANKFNDTGINALFKDIILDLKFEVSSLKNMAVQKVPEIKFKIIPTQSIQYLREIADTVRKYNKESDEIANKLEDYFSLKRSVELLTTDAVKKELTNTLDNLKNSISPDVFVDIEKFENVRDQYRAGKFTYNVRDKAIAITTKYVSLSMQEISKVACPSFRSKADLYQFIRSENLPGSFPYVAGIFPFKRKDEDPKRMFAGEGGPKRTNARFHFLSKDDDAKRLSTAFDSVTLYGEDPDERPDIFGKVGEAGVSIATLQDMQDLYDGFDLTATNTSVSMTINGPAPIILAMFMNTAINQKLSISERDNFEKCLEIMRKTRGTVQADILKEDQAQNTCIFSLEFALKLMGDVQAYFCKHAIKNYYTVSISGYHIAEAGANPITQLALTLSNGFTYIEYYLNRGLHIDDFAENLSFFFSNGLDAEYTVIGRVARKIWATTLKYKYGASDKSQKLKYHIQTSGRSLHAQEIDFNDIRTTLQAFLALSDNCNSLHTNAYDEAITTPTEESVRRAMAIQMIINREFGLNKTDNPLQGSFIVNELTALVEEAVLQEFERISDKGGVLGAMESMYQRSKIQEESLHYETMKDSGALPIIGVNTYLNPKAKEQLEAEIQITRASHEEKMEQIKRLRDFKQRHISQSKNALIRLKEVCLNEENIFEELLTTVKYCTLGEITKLLYEVGGSYRRNM